MSEILEDIVSEGERLLGIASGQGVPLRLLGGVAVRLKALASDEVARGTRELCAC